MIYAGMCIDCISSIYIYLSVFSIYIKLKVFILNSRLFSLLYLQVPIIILSFFIKEKFNSKYILILISHFSNSLIIVIDSGKFCSFFGNTKLEWELYTYNSYFWW